MKQTFVPLLFCLLLTSCRTARKVIYLQDATNHETIIIPAGGELTIQPQDRLSIIVSSKNPKLATLFNLPVVTYTAGNNSTSSYNQLVGYTVNPEGNIQFPVLGAVKVEGLTRAQIAETLTKQFIAEQLIDDAIITVDYMNLYISVLGEVSRPGRFKLDRDKTTLLDALAQAGDLTIYGRRDRVLVIREENGQRSTYYVDLRSKDLFSSPVYYLKQNDAIYVEPNHTRTGQSTVNANSVKSVSIWISISSFLTSLGVLLFK